MGGLRLENVKTVFDGGCDIGPVSLQLPKGQMMALLGASGSGKTTTLRMIAGLAPVVEGQLFFDQMNLTEVPARKRHVGMVFQNFGLFPHLNVADNISFGLRMQKVDKKIIADKLDWIIGRTRLGGLESRFASELSGGQKQRVALARTLVMDPDILLLDEPLSNLDANLREEMALFIKDLQRDLGITTVFVTHDQQEALMLADLVVVMAQGRVLQQGSPAKVFENPASVEVADFMGGANLLKGTVKPSNRVETEIGLLSMPDLKSSPGQSVTLMIRPEHIQMDDAADTETNLKITLTGEVISARYHGGFIAYEIKVGAGSLSVRRDSMKRFDVGSSVILSFDPAHIWPMPDNSFSDERGLNS